MPYRVRMSAKVIVQTVAVAALAMPAACSRPAVCDGVTREAGGCTADQPTFVATDCPALAREFAEQYEEAAHEDLRRRRT